jgi:DNA-binding transcriptional LysR family regulator
MTKYYITDLLSRFQDKYPNFTMNIIGGDTVELNKMIADGSLDFAFIRTHGYSAPQDYETLPYFTAHMVAVFSKKHPLSNEDSVSLDQLKEESLLLLQKGSFMYSLSKKACESAGFSPHISFTGHRAENIVDLAARDMGVGLLTRQPLKFIDISKVSIVNLVPQFTTDIVLTYKSEQSLSTASRHFLKFYKSLGSAQL